MRLFIIAILVMTSCFAQAVDSCYDKVDTEMAEEMASKNWKYHGIDALDTVQVDEILANPHDWTTEMTDDELAELEQKYVLPGENEFYLLTGTGDYSGGFQELIVVNAASCEVEKRYVMYVE